MIVSIDSTMYDILQTSLSLSDMIGQRSTCSFTIEDPGMSRSFSKGQLVQVLDPIDGTTVMFGGIVDRVTVTKIPGASYRFHQIDCADWHYLADKRIVAKIYENMYAGDIVADLINNYLGQEGVIGSNVEYTAQAYEDFVSGTFSSTLPFDDGAGGQVRLVDNGGFSYEYLLAADWTSGTTISNAGGTGADLSVSGDALTITGERMSFDSIPGSWTLFGESSPTDVTSGSDLILTTAAGKDARLRLDDIAGQTDFNAQLNTIIPSDASQVGFAYRTTHWQNNNNTFAYMVGISSGSVQFGKGNNAASGAGAFTSLAVASHGLSAGTEVQLRIVIKGTSHKVYVNGSLLINKTDSTYTATGEIALRAYNSTSGSSISAFGFTNSTTGKWTSGQSFTLDAGNFQYGFLSWTATVPTTTTLAATVQYSTDGGSTYSSEISIINGGSVPIPSGTPFSQIQTKINFYFDDSLDIVNTPTLADVKILLASGYALTGNWTSPAISLASIISAGSSLVSWDAVVPTNTTLTVATSVNGGSTYQNVTNGGPIANLLIATNPIQDTFSEDTSSNYNYNPNPVQTGFTATWDTTDQELQVSFPTNASSKRQVIYVNDATQNNCQVDVDVFKAHKLRISPRYTVGGSYYGLQIDSDDAGTSGTLTLMKRVSGVETTLHTYSVSFHSGDLHKASLYAFDTTLKVYFDGILLGTITDSSVSVGGNPSMHFVNDTSVIQNSTIKAFTYQQLGQNLTSKSVIIQVTLNAPDATATPQLQDIHLAFRSITIDNGPLVEQAVFAYETGAQCLDDLAGQANFWWKIDQNRVMWFKPNQSLYGPFIATGDTVLTDVQVEDDNPNYRNRQYIIGGRDTSDPQTETQVGDGSKQSFTVKYPIASIPTITVNGVAQTVGQKGSSGSAFYWADNDAVVAQDPAGTPLLSTDIIVIVYQGYFDVVVAIENNAAVLARQALEQNTTTGYVEQVDTAPNTTTRLSADQIAQSKLDLYSAIGRTLTFSTRQRGISAGQLMCVYLPEHNINYDYFLVESVSIVDDGQSLIYQVKAVEGPIDDSWTKFFTKIIQSSNPVTINVGSGQVLVVSIPIDGFSSWTELVHENHYVCPITNTSLLCGNSTIVC